MESDRFSETTFQGQTYRILVHPVFLGSQALVLCDAAPSPAAIANAINDALRPLGARVTTQPMTPEVILTALGKV